LWLRNATPTTPSFFTLKTESRGFLALVVGTVERWFDCAGGEPDAMKRKICGKMELPCDVENIRGNDRMQGRIGGSLYTPIACTASSSAGNFLLEKRQ
jgi:hypothetical protein